MSGGGGAAPAAGAGIPSREYPVTARAPGKVILFGEHAVVHGRPELLLAIDLHTQVTGHRAAAWSLNRRTAAVRENPYLAALLADAGPGGRPLALTAVSRLPRASGLGSSAAFVAAVLAVVAAGSGGCGRAALAGRSYAVERAAQGGVGSPGDTAATVFGGLLALNGGPGPVLWESSDGNRSWSVRRIADPGWTWVIGYSGTPHDTAATVRAVGRRLARPDGASLLDRFAGVADEGIRAVAAEERERVGALLDENQRLLAEIGVSTPRLEGLLEAVRPASAGAKLTGAGAGGSIVVLPRAGREMEVVRRLARAGAIALAVRTAPVGVSLLEPPGPEGEAPPPAEGP